MREDEKCHRCDRRAEWANWWQDVAKYLRVHWYCTDCAVSEQAMDQEGPRYYGIWSRYYRVVHPETATPEELVCVEIIMHRLCALWSWAS